MVKRALNILFALIVTAIVATGGVLPHHHHAQGSICFATSQESDQTNNDHDTCPLEQKLVASVGGVAHHHKCGICSAAADHDNHHHSTHAPVLAAFTAIDYAVLLDAQRWDYKPFDRISIVSQRVLYSPLRAPPVA